MRFMPRYWGERGTLCYNAAMPIFEFSCNCCGKPRFSALVGVVADSAPPACPACGSSDLTKRISRFARGRSEEETLDALADRADTIDENDPKAIRSLVREMASGMDDEISADELEMAMEEELSAGAENGSDTTEDWAS
jgi:putative FmdB family regulatory protein